MTIETKINLNMTNNQAPVVVDAVQNEQLTRVISATLYDGTRPWSVPGDVKAGLAFRKPDGTGGLYDQLPNHSIAVAIVGNNVKATLAPQVQSVAGDVAAAIVFMVPSTMERLATFPFILRVAKDPSAGATVSNDYYQYSTMEEVNAAIKDVKASANAATEAVAGFQQAVASAIPVTMTGETISTDIVSSVEHEIKCRIFENSEFNGYAYENVTHEREGMTFSYDKNGYVTLNGYLSTNIYERINKKVIPLEPGDYYICGFTVPESKKMYIEYRTRNGVSGSIPSTDPGKVITIEKPDSLESLTFRGFWKSEFSNETFQIRIIKGTSDPVPDPTAVTVTQQPGGLTFKPNKIGAVPGMVSRSPNMEISTDNPNVTIEATYNADTKKYIDSKFTELQAAILSTGGNV